MRTTVRALVLSLFITEALWFGCGGSTTGGTTSSTTSGTGGTGGATSSTTTTATGAQAVSVGAGGAIDTCIADNGPDGGLNGKCDLLGGENCDCKECLDTAFCIPDLCTTDGVCDPTYDSCICPDCDTFHFCANPQKANCVNDGTCDSFHEGCTCPDCADKAECKDNIEICDGGKLDGVCSAQETCACADCFGTPKCLPCTVNGTCNTYDPCFCADCIDNDYCTDPTKCTDDGVCDALLEGCVCDDCASIPECTNPTGSGGGGGAATTTTTTGAGGAGGMAP
ncbi:MAG: hypothetical protein U0359_38325 [Byssovorax sp.]